MSLLLRASLGGIIGLTAGCAAESGGSPPLTSGFDTGQTDTAGPMAPGADGPPTAPPSAPAPGPEVPEPIEPEVCERIELIPDPVEPDVLIVLDRSESMRVDNSGFVPVQTMRWEPAVQAVKDVTAALETSVRFGLMVFPDQAGRCAAGEMSLPLALDNALPIAAELDTHEPGGATPLAVTLDRAREELIADRSVPDQPPRDKYVLLVTDGEPTCHVDNSPPFDNDEEASYAAVTALAEERIKTYVVGYDTAGSAALDEMAVRGDTGDTAHRSVSDGPSLVEELQRIAGTLVSCTFELDQAPGDPDYVRVEVDGVTYALDDDWRLLDDTQVELGDAPCQLLRDGERHVLEITVECEPVVVI